MKLEEKKSALPLCSKYLVPLRSGGVMKMVVGTNILGDVGQFWVNLRNCPQHNQTSLKLFPSYHSHHDYNDGDDVEIEDDDDAHCP